MKLTMRQSGQLWEFVHRVRSENIQVAFLGVDAKDLPVVAVRHAGPDRIYALEPQGGLGVATHPIRPNLTDEEVEGLTEHQSILLSQLPGSFS